MGIAEAILALIQYAPAAIDGIESVYAAVKGDLSNTEIDQIDAALAKAQAADAAATAKADTALDDAAKR